MDRKALSFARNSMRDDRIRVDKQNPPEHRWSDEAAEKVFARIIGEE